MIIIIVICFVVGLTCFGELGLEERTNAGEWSERKESSPQALTVATSALAGSGSQGPLRKAARQHVCGAAVHVSGLGGEMPRGAAPARARRAMPGGARCVEPTGVPQ